MRAEVVLKPDDPQKILQKFIRDNFVHVDENTREFMRYLRSIDPDEIDAQWALEELMLS